MRLIKDLYDAQMELLTKEATKFLKKKTYEVVINSQCETIINDMNLF